MTELAAENLTAARGRGVIYTTAAGAVFQGVYALSQFVVLAALLRHIGAERFGMWTTVWSIGAWAMVTHLGLGHTLLSELGRCVSVDRERARRVLSAAVICVSAVSLCLILFLLLVGPMLDWSYILNVESKQAVSEALPVTLIALLMALVGVPLSLGGTALLATQRGQASFSAQIVAHVVCVCAVLLGVRLGWTLPLLTAVVFSAPIIAGVLQWLMLSFGRRSLRPGRWDAGVARSLLVSGAVFFAMELLGIAMMQTGPLIIARCLGAQAVAPYAAVFRLIGLMLAIYSVVMLAYWPAFADAKGRLDHAWFKRGLVWSLQKTLVVWLLGAVGIWFLGDAFIRWWLGPEVVPSSLLTAWMIVFVGLQGAFLWITTPLKGVFRLRVQVVSGAVMTCGFIPLAVLLSDRFGAAAVPISQSAVIVLIGLPMNALELRRVIRDLHRRAAEGGAE